MDFEILIPIVAIIFGCMIPIVRILTKHQKEMAELMHGGQSSNLNALFQETQMLRNEVAMLRQTVNDHHMAIDTIQNDTRQLQARAGANPEL